MINPDSILFKKNVYTSYINVNTKRNWYLETSDERVICTPSSGGPTPDTGTTVTVTHSFNDIVENKEMIYFYADDSQTECGIIIKPIDAVLELINDIGGDEGYLFEYTGDSMPINFKTTGDWKITTPNWCNVSSDSGAAGDDIVVLLNITQNNGFQRDGYVKIYLEKKPDIYVTLHIKQGSTQGSFKDMISVNIDFTNNEEPFYVYEGIDLGNVVNNSEWDFVDSIKQDIGNITTMTRKLLISIASKEYREYSYYVHAIANVTFEYMSNNPEFYQGKIAPVTITWDLSYLDMVIPNTTNSLIVSFSGNDSDFTIVRDDEIPMSSAKIKNGVYYINMPTIYINVIEK